MTYGFYKIEFVRRDGTWVLKADKDSCGDLVATSTTPTGRGASSTMWELGDPVRFKFTTTTGETTKGYVTYVQLDEC